MYPYGDIKNVSLLLCTSLIAVQTVTKNDMHVIHDQKDLAVIFPYILGRTHSSKYFWVKIPVEHKGGGNLKISERTLTEWTWYTNLKNVYPVKKIEFVHTNTK